MFLITATPLDSKVKVKILRFCLTARNARTFLETFDRGVHIWHINGLWCVEITTKVSGSGITMPP